MKYWKDILGTVLGGAMTAALIWIATNVVWAEDLQRVIEQNQRSDMRFEKLLLEDSRRDISRDLRKLSRIDEPTERDADAIADLSEDLARIETELGRLEDAATDDE